MANALIDNSDDYKLVKYIRELTANPNCRHIRIATGYWDLPGTALIYDELKGFFERGGRLDLLIGEEPRLQYYQVNEDVKKFPDFYIQRDVNHLTDEYLPIGQLINEYAKTEENPDGLFEIRVYGQGEHKEFLHAKCYIFEGENNLGTGIVGSSNFTQKGLEGNAELNYLEENPLNVISKPIEGVSLKSHKTWFLERWDFSEPWTGKFIKEILMKSPLGGKIQPKPIAPTIEDEKLTPYEVYIKYLQTQFGDIIDPETTEILKTYLPANYSPLEFQLDAVKQGFSIMKRHGGFILGDVVGLGKTVVGLLLIRMFLDQAESLNRPRKVLVVVPPSIKKGWINTIRDFDRDHATKIEPLIDFVTTGSIAAITGEVDDIPDGGDEFTDDLKKTQYGLIVVDESHNFRNRETQKYKALDELIGITNPTPFVCLMSATPQNNSPQDLYNQILLFERDANNVDLPNIPGGKLDTFFRAMKTEFDVARKIPGDTEEQRDEARRIIAGVSKEIREKVLNELVVRRTRTDIKKLYGKDAENLHFPTIVGPEKIVYRMDDELQQLFYDTVNAIYPTSADTEAIKFYRYAAINFFKDPKNKKLYEKRNLTVESITARLQKIMQILLVKRLESSQVAFKTSLSNLLDYTDVMIEMLRNDRVYVCPDIDVNKVYREADGDFRKFAEEMDRKIEKKGENNRCFSAEDFTPEYFEDLQADRRLISKLLKRWDRNSYDPKFEKFKEKIPTLFDPKINNPSGKNRPRVVIFTEAIDTLKDIERALKNSGHRPLAITAVNRDERADAIAANFDANLPLDRQRDDYDSLVTTEVLAEGVNLHRANVILNYDAPWNATRLMQRIGRVNRIGSVEEFVHVFNFFPSEEGNVQIRLVEKAYAKLQSFHEMFGEDSKVFSEREEVRENDLNHIVDGDESPFGVYIRELKEYSETSPDRYEYIKALPLDHLGGFYPGENKKHSLYIFADQTDGLVSIEIDRTDGVPRPVSPLATMELLKCSPDDRFDDVPFDADSEEYKLALQEYHQLVTHVLGGRDSSKQISDAQAYIGELRSNPDVTPETKELLKRVRRLVRNNNRFVIKTLLRQKKESDNRQLSLFGADYDINTWLQTTFSHIADRAVERRGESTLALYEIK